MRAGTLIPLRSVPPGKFVVLGLVATKIAQLETADYLKRRIEEASRYISLEQLCLSPQCGFSTSAAEHVAVTEGMEKAKLARIVEVGAAVWGTRHSNGAMLPTVSLHFDPRLPHHPPLAWRNRGL